MTMPQSTSDPIRDDEFFHRVHHQPKKLLNELVGVPAHIHHVAHRMTNPPIERPQSEDEFRYVLQCLDIADEAAPAYSDCERGRCPGRRSEEAE